MNEYHSDYKISCEAPDFIRNSTLHHLSKNAFYFPSLSFCISVDGLISSNSS